MNNRKIKNITLTNEQLDYVKVNDGKMSLSELSKMLGIGVNKIQKNRELIGLVNHKTKVVSISKKYFNIDDFKKYYEY